MLRQVQARTVRKKAAPRKKKIIFWGFAQVLTLKLELMFKKANKTHEKSTISMPYVFLCTLACCHASVFAAQAPSGSDFDISGTWTWTQVVTEFFKDSPKMVQDGRKFAPNPPRIAPR